LKKAIKATLKKVNAARSKRAAQRAVKKALHHIVSKVTKTHGAHKINKMIKKEKKKLGKKAHVKKGKKSSGKKSAKKSSSKKHKAVNVMKKKPHHKSVKGILKHNSRRQLAKKVAKIGR